jgi:hypothetical protein
MQQPFMATSGDMASLTRIDAGHDGTTLTVFSKDPLSLRRVLADAGNEKLLAEVHGGYHLLRCRAEGRKKNNKTIFTVQVYSRFHGKIGFTVCKLRVSAEGFHALLLKHLQMQNFMIYSYFKTSHAQEAKQKPYVNQNNKHNAE